MKTASQGYERIPRGVLATLIALGVVGALLLSGHLLSAPPEERLDPARISEASAWLGSFDPQSSVFKGTLPRSDLKVAIDGTPIPSAMGLTAWFTLSGTRQHAVLLGTIPLREEEVNGILKSALDLGLGVSALHNTFLMDSPRVMSLHLEGTGSEEALARAVGQIFHEIAEKKIPLDRPEPSKRIPSDGSLDVEMLEKRLGKGVLTDGVYRITRGRGTRLAGILLSEPAEVMSWADFTGSSEHALATGDLAALEEELTDLLKALIAARIRIVSIHTHMTGEKPKLVFVHYWGTGKLDRLAQGVEEALAAQDLHQSK